MSGENNNGLWLTPVESSSFVENEGYISYCPCMGRFGNQMEQFLGTLAFAKHINRTLIVSPIIHYIHTDPGSKFIPFDNLFNLTALSAFHRVIGMTEFINAQSLLWPRDKRISFCYSNRDYDSDIPLKECKAKHGRPFGPFWDHLGIDFVGSQFYGPLDPVHSSAKEWNQRFNTRDFPVMAFVGQPGAFPALEEHLPIHAYLQWSDAMNAKANDFIQRNLPRPFVALHLRNNVDFLRVCQMIKPGSHARHHIFSSAQCHGHQWERDADGLTYDQCAPSLKTILSDVSHAVKVAGAKSIFIATDLDSHQWDLSTHTQLPVVSTYPTDDLYLDVAILGRADLAILNCVSSFSAFAKRQRDSNRLPTWFFAFTNKNVPRVEL